MYKIIGADQKEYGPITADQICKWISEGRADAQSSVCAEGSSEWKPLGSFPEFADLFHSPSTPANATSPLDTSLPIQPPGSIKVFGVLNIVFGSLRLLSVPISLIALSVAAQKAHYQITTNTWLIFSLLLGTIVGILMLTSGIGLCKMRAWARRLAVYTSVCICIFTLMGFVVTFASLAKMMKLNSSHVPVVPFIIPLFTMIITLGYNVLLIFFLFKPEVKRALGETRS